MSGSGRGGDNRGSRRKPFKRRDREDAQAHNRDASKNGEKKQADFSPVNEGKVEKGRGGFIERPRWVPPKPPAITLPSAVCAWCGKPIKDISAAFCEPDSGNPVHFDCVINRIIEGEVLETGDAVSYIGGGRFGVIHFNNPPDTRDFTIKKVFEWENRENRADWRVTISDYYSVT